MYTRNASQHERTTAGPTQHKVALQAEVHLASFRLQMLASDEEPSLDEPQTVLHCGGKQRAAEPNMPSTSYTIQTMGCYSELCGGSWELIWLNNCHGTIQTRTSSAWEFQFVATDLAVNERGGQTGQMRTKELCQKCSCAAML